MNVNTAITVVTAIFTSCQFTFDTAAGVTIEVFVGVVTSETLGVVVICISSMGAEITSANMNACSTKINNNQFILNRKK